MKVTQYIPFMQNKVMEMTTNNSDVQPTNSRLPLWGSIGCCVSIVCLVACIGAYFLFFRDATMEPANTETIQKVTQTFVEALRNNQFASARDMFSEKIRPTIPMSDLESLAQEDPISAFQNLSVCEFQVNLGSAGRQIVGYGLLHYDSGVVIFESTLVRDTDNVWRIYGFYLQPHIDATPSGACKIN